MKDFDRERVRESLRNDPDGLHQALLNIAYDEWQKQKGWSMEDMLQYALEFGNIVQLAVLLGKYNQQVTNGGHSQYFDNGYSGEHERGRSYYNYDTPISIRMLALLRKYKLDTTDNGMVVAECIGEFINRTHAWEDGDRSYCDYDEECDEDDSMPSYDDLDTKYYKVCDAWMSDLERYFRLWMEHNEDPIATGRF